MTITQSSLLFPCCAMVGITAVVWAKLFGDRLHEMRSRKISPQAIATSRQSAKVLQKVNASDNFSNLFEVPVLFYVLCALAFSAQLVTPPAAGRSLDIRHFARASKSHSLHLQRGHASLPRLSAQHTDSVCDVGSLHGPSAIHLQISRL